LFFDPDLVLCSWKSGSLLLPPLSEFWLSSFLSSFYFFSVSEPFFDAGVKSRWA
jgi:hypothetical protein